MSLTYEVDGDAVLWASEFEVGSCYLDEVLEHQRQKGIESLDDAFASFHALHFRTTPFTRGGK